MNANKLICKYRELKEALRRKWILYRTGYPSWKVYLRYTDPRYNYRASKIKDIYHGYPFVYQFMDRRHMIYDWNVHIDGAYMLDQWCKDNIKGAYRFDCHRVMCFSGAGNEWEINEISGGDYYYAAFENERDYTWFLMRWS